MLVSFSQTTIISNTEQLKQFWEFSKYLGHDALLCLVNSNGAAIFMSVFDEKLRYASTCTRLKCFCEDVHRAKLQLRFIEPFENDVNLVASCFPPSTTTSSILVEFPGIVLLSFYPTLQALQRMIPRPNLPFSELIAPTDTSNLEPEVKPPPYSMEQRFSFDMSCLIQGKRLRLTPGEEFDFETLNNHSTLDPAQQTAVC